VSCARSQNCWLSFKDLIRRGVKDAWSKTAISAKVHFMAPKGWCVMRPAGRVAGR